MRKCRLLPLFMAFCVLLNTAALPVRADNPGSVDYLNTHVNTGNQREDLVAIALTQLGYMEKDVNDTKYGDWTGFPFQPWCASFVTWCARQADISTDILKHTARAHPDYYDIDYYHGSKYTPRPGDLFFTEEFTHVGIVWYVEGEFFYCIEGNAKYHDYTVPDDPDVESYHVMTNKRLIRNYYFGVPEYEGCDGNHDYVKGTESAHPHKTYYLCSTCGDKYYTGYTACRAGCSRCFSCGCSSSVSGYYQVSLDNGPIKLRTAHSTSSGYNGYAANGAVVYVHGANTSTGWAYIEYDGKMGHTQLKYLKKYHDIPASPTLTADQAEYIVHDSATVTWNAPANSEQYRLQVYRDGKLYKEQNMGTSRSYTMQDLPEGTYEVRVTACNRAGASKPGTLNFTVLGTYTLTYDARGGTGAPDAQTQGAGRNAAVSSTVPVRDGYTFLGWTLDAEGSFVQYTGGDTLSAYEDITLYAVWKSDDAAAQTMTIARMPACTVYLKGEALDLTGLALELHYSDGSGHTVTEGYTASGFDADTYGTKTITVEYGGLAVSFEVQVVPYLPGDIDRNMQVDRDDVMQLLWHISFPAEFPVTVPADFTRDGAVDRDDVMQLLWHISFPDQFPLEIEWPEEELPTDPTDPTEPEQPTEPEEPTDPTEPTEPENPTVPDDPTEPEEPTEPETQGE